jgi:hypothetical protein
LAHTLYQLAQCYSLKGDRRHADLYATASLKALHVDVREPQPQPHSTSISTSIVNDEGDDDDNVTTVSLSCRQAEALRQSQDIQSHASSVLTVRGNANNSNSNSNTDSDSDNLALDGTQMHWQLHHIKTLMSRGDQLRQSMGLRLGDYSDPDDVEQVVMQAHDLYQHALDTLNPLLCSDNLLVTGHPSDDEELSMMKKRSAPHDSHDSRRPRPRPDPVDPPFDKRLAQLYHQLLLRIGLCLDLDLDSDLQQHQEENDEGGDMDMDANGNANIMDLQPSGSIRSSCQDIYQQVRGSPYATWEDKWQATYQLGCVALKEARRDGSLQQLWGGLNHHDDEEHEKEHAHSGSSSSSSSSLDLARHYLKEVCEGMPVTSQRCRHALRCLALATGPGDDAEGRTTTTAPPTSTASLLLHKSLGASACATVADAYRQTPDQDDQYQLRLFESLHNVPLNQLEASVERQLTNHLPLEWNVVTMTLCPVTGEVLVSSLSRDPASRRLQSDTQCLTWNTYDDSGSSSSSGSNSSSLSSFQERVLQPFHSIMVRNKRQLHGMDPDHVAHYGTKEARKMWWTDRRALDEELGALLEQTHQDYFDAPHITQLFAAREPSVMPDHAPDGPGVNANANGSSSDNDDDDKYDDDDIQMTNLANKFDAVAVVSSSAAVTNNKQHQQLLQQEANDKAIANALSKETEADIKARTIPQLKEILIERFGVPKATFRGMRKANLVELFLQQQDQEEEEHQQQEQEHEDDIDIELDIDIDIEGPAAHPTLAMEETQEDNSDSEDCTLTMDEQAVRVPPHHYYVTTPTTFLILDEQLQCFPWESLPLFQTRANSNENASTADYAAAVCRVPSLPFVVSPLLATSRRDVTEHVNDNAMTINPSRVSYVLDPESNLTLTQTRVGDALREIQIEGGLRSDANDVEWQGVMGELPTEAFMQQALTNNTNTNTNTNTSQAHRQAQGAGLYLFCGHGGGTKAFSRVQVEELMYMSSDDDGVMSRQPHDKAAPSVNVVPNVRRCQSSVILMGCSSGKLSSNFDEDYIDVGIGIGIGAADDASHSHSRPPPLPYYEASGLALSYLQAGAPCVVANLWDVTDGDIDKYCIQLLRDFFLDHLVDGQGDGEDVEAGDSSQPAPFHSRSEQGDEHEVEQEQETDSHPPNERTSKPKSSTSQLHSLAHHVALARSACKLRYLVGSAPVCYGVPVFLL